MNEYLEIVLRTLLAIVVLLLLTRLNGAKQISQLTSYDYVVGITAGSIAASLCIDLEVNIWYCLIGMTLFMLSSFLLSVLTNKSIFMRRALTGSPNFLIAGGKIMYDRLKHAHFDINDLLRELRVAGYFDINDINYAVLETNGTLSVLPKAGARPSNTTEQGMSLPEDGISANVVLDGKIMKANAEAFGKSIDWVRAEIKKQKLELKNVALATLNESGELSVYLKEKAPTAHSVFQ